MGAIGAIGGSVIGTAGNLWGASKQNTFNAEQALKQMLFQERAYKNRYQWQVEDMKKAGLNPALAYSQGAGSSPSGASAQSADLSSIGTKAINSALAIKMNKATVENLEKTNEKISAETQNVEAQTAKTLQDTQYQTTINKYLDENQQRQIEKLIWDTYYANPYRTVTGIVEKTWDDIKDVTGHLYNSAKDSDVVGDIKAWILEKANEVKENLKNQKGSFWNKQPFKSKEKKK